MKTVKILTLVILIPLASRAELIATWDTNLSSGLLSAPQNNSYLQLFLGAGGLFVPDSQVFNSLQFTPSQVGQTFDASLVNSTGLDAFTQHLTDGTDSTISHGIVGYAFQINMKESILIGDSPHVKNNIDLQGYEITTISFTVNNVLLDEVINVGTPGSPVSRFQDTLSGTISVYGNAVPEPNSAALVLLGTGLFYLRRKRFSNQRVELTRKTLVDFKLS